MNIDVKRAHFGQSVNYKGRERLYAESGEGITLTYKPEIACLEIKDSKTGEVILATAYNIKYMVSDEKKEQPVPLKASSSGSK